MKKIAILCDFDGTVASEDIGNLFFRTFTGEESSLKVIEQWKGGFISSRHCLEREAAMASASREEIDHFLQGRTLDPYFKDFFDFAKKRGMEIVILSDGLDYYIEKILVRFGLAEMDFFANKLELKNHTLRVDFPFYNLLDCQDCGNCKKYHLEKYKRNGYFIVYVGDGLSDRCPSESADMVFAKGDLLRFCRENGIAHIEFRNFRDIEREMLNHVVLGRDWKGTAGG